MKISSTYHSWCVLTALLVISYSLFTSCKKDDDDDITPTDNNPIELLCGQLDAAMTLTNHPNKPVDYVIRCNMNVDGALTIEPGVVIAFEAGRGLNITANGSINATGTAEEPILFTGLEKVKGSWAGIMIRSASPLNKLQYVTVEYGGQTGFWSNGVNGNVNTWVNAKLVMNHCQLNKSSTFGMNVYHLGSADVTLNENNYTDNQAPLRINGEDIWIPSPTDDYTGNVENKIEVVVYTAQIDVNRTWRKVNVPYKLTGTQELVIDANLTIEPGTQIEMGQNTGINVTDNGGLKAVGLPAERISISGELGTKGSWHNISFNGTNPTNEIGYADIFHSGQDITDDPGAVMLWYNARLNIHDVHFEELATCGVAYRLLSSQTSNPNFTFSNLTFTNVACEVETY